MATAMAGSPAFRLVFSLDITGSMSSELEGVKQAVAELVKLTEDLDVPLSYVVSTFTEGRSHCCASLAEFGSAAEAHQYVQAIKCCRPPEEPDLNLSGDDGPENHKAALVRLTDLKIGPPTFLFLITDAPPHLQSDRPTDTHRAELKWLQGRGLEEGLAADVFRVFEHVNGHFGGSLVANCVLYTPSIDCQGTYGQLTKATGGMLMRPSSREAALLARGMLDIVRALLARVVPGAPAHDVSELEGFALLDTSQLVPRATEQDPAVGEVVAGDSEQLFAIAMKRMCAVCGKKWSKRARGMAAPAQQLEFVWRTARALLRPAGAADVAPADLDRLAQLRQQVLEELPEDSRGHFSVSLEDVQAWAAQAAAAVAAGGSGGGGGAATSCISLATVGDALEEEADWEDWLASVMRLLLGFPLRLRLPLDREGRPDFMDAWSAVIEKLGVDRMSSAEFMELVGPNPTVTGPTDGAQHNAFLVAVEPGDELASLVFKAASGTQVLNYVTGVLMGARGFLPNLHAGTSAACLLSLLSSPTAPSEFRWRQAHTIAHTLRSMHRPPARPIARELEAGRANPADPASKLVAALLGMGAGSGDAAAARQLLPAVRLVLEEWMAGMVQRQYGKCTLESDAAYLASVQQYIPLELLLPGAAAVDPLARLHPLEQEDAELAGQVAPGWQAAAIRRLRGTGTAEDGGTKVHPVLERFERNALALLAVMFPAECGISGSSVAPEPGRAEQLLAEVWPDWEQGLITCLLLRARTARYRLVSAGAEDKDDGEGKHGGADAAADGSAEGVAAAPAAAGADVASWERVAVASNTELALGRQREAMAAELAGYRQARVAEARARLLQASADALQAVMAAGGDEEAFSAALEGLYLPLGPGGAVMAAGERPQRPGTAPRGPVATLLGQAVSLQRYAVPDILQQLGVVAGSSAAAGADARSTAAAEDTAAAGEVPAALLRALVVGPWTTGPPQVLRKSLTVRQLCMERAELADLLEVLAARMLCMRDGRHNRHGHSLQLQYPGPEGWTEEYAAARLAAVPWVAAYVRTMRRFTEMATWARGTATSASSDQLVMQVEALLAGYEDANCLLLALGKVEQLLGQKMPVAAAVAAV